jgi:hypothetical protein
MDYFKKALTTKQLALYYDRLYHMEPNAIEAALDNIIATRKPTPGQFPSIVEIMSAARQQGLTRPRSEIEYQDCKECHNTGHIYVFQVKNGLYTEVAYICASCNNWMQHFNSLQYVDGDGNRSTLIQETLRALLARDDVYGPVNEENLKQIKQINQKAKASGTNLYVTPGNIGDSLPSWVTD